MRLPCSHPPSNLIWISNPFFCPDPYYPPKICFPLRSCLKPKGSQLLYHIPSLLMTFLRRCSQSDLSCSLARAALPAPSTGSNQVHLSTLDTTPFLHRGGRNLHSIPYEIFTFSSRQDSIIATKSEPDRGGLLSPSHLTPSKPGATPPCLKLVHTNHWWSF